MSDATRSLLHLRNNPPKAKFGSKHKNGTFGMKGCATNLWVEGAIQQRAFPKIPPSAHSVVHSAGQ